MVDVSTLGRVVYELETVCEESWSFKHFSARTAKNNEDRISGPQAEKVARSKLGPVTCHSVRYFQSLHVNTRVIFFL